MKDHDRALSEAFDGQAARFERAPVQSDPAGLEWLVRAADLPAGTRVFDAGCGPGLVCEALLRAGCRVTGVDLSAEMVDRARKRCAAFGDRASFARQSVFDPAITGPFDAAVSRLVLHHTPDAAAFVRRLVELVRPGGVVVICDHTTDPDPARAAWHQDLERARDRTHTLNFTPGGLVDLLAGAGLTDLRLVERLYLLDYDEWFDRGTPAEAKDAVRVRLLNGSSARGFRPTVEPGGAVRIEGCLAVVRGVVSEPLAA
jgi:SAM-dependent methyltransferase